MGMNGDSVTRYEAWLLQACIWVSILGTVLLVMQLCSRLTRWYAMFSRAEGEGLLAVDRDGSNGFGASVIGGSAADDSPTSAGVSRRSWSFFSGLGGGSPRHSAEQDATAEASV